MTTQQAIIIVKVGGRFFDELLDATTDGHPLLHALVALQKVGRKAILVHGGGDQVQAQLRALSMPSEKLDGLRVTPFSHMPVVTGVLAGYLNKSLVAQSRAVGLNTVGISLSDGNIASCLPINPELGAVGAPHAGDVTLINALLDNHIMPIIASVGCDEKGNLYNVNADHAATCIAKLVDGQLLLLSDVKGVLNAEKSKLDTLSAEQAKTLVVNKVITDGMIVKVRAAQEAADTLGRNVTIGSWNDVSAFVSDIEQSADLNKAFGTQISPR